MGPDIFYVVTVLTLLLITLTTAQNKTATNSTDEYDVKRLEKKIYGGKVLEPPPEKLVVTEEVWFDLKIKDYYGEGEHYKERITIACFGKLTPITCLNFISLAKGYKKGRSIMTYKGTKVQSIVRDFMIQMGDVKTKYASGDSIFGSSFQDESFALSHNHAGWVGMANFGPDTNGSQFYILLRSARWLDGRHVLFGKVITGMDVLRTIAQEQTGKDNNPLRPVVVDGCGINRIKDTYTMTAEQLDTDGDIDMNSA